MNKTINKYVNSYLFNVNFVIKIFHEDILIYTNKNVILNKNNVKDVNNYIR